ncbi:DUF4132 domain-containing protein [Actinomadura kijaniata]|uniref:DUF4132 domain-containing protein n=1 Tax=Actinomadura kijaniata TaxID=46161 RepID=UPI0008304DED|nr:DUF4132 domain-containing protein [Actinomadura kijaniata]
MPNPPHDENTLTLPAGWARGIHPRRGGLPRSRTSARRAARTELADLVAEKQPALDSLLTKREGDPDLAEAARRYLEGEADPTGAGTVAAVLGVRERDRDVPGTCVDAWTAEHGPAFAACALVEWGSFRASWTRGDVMRVQRRNGCGVGPEGAGRRMRTLLAAADEGAYAEAVRRLAGLRTSPRRRLVVAYLVPTRHDWVTEACREITRNAEDRRLVLCSIGTAEHVAVLGRRAALGWGERTLDVVATLLDGLGPAALPVLLTSLDESGDLAAAEAGRLLEAVALLPGDEAFRALLDRRDDGRVPPALLAAARRFPRRALGLLAPLAADPRVAELLDDHLRAHPELRTDDLPAEVRAAGTGRVGVPDAGPEELPAVLADPPWNRPREAAPVVPGLTPPGLRVSWPDGERDAWAASVWRRDRPEDTDWAREHLRFRTGRLRPDEVLDMLIAAPDEYAKGMLALWNATLSWDAAGTRRMRAVVARHGADAFRPAVRAARADPRECGGLLLPYLDAEVAALMAEWLDRKRTRPHTIAWLGWHGMDAARLLIPAALGKPVRARRLATEALALLADEHGSAALVATAREYGDEAATAIETLERTHRLGRAPAEPPVIGDWADPAVLPRVLLAGRDRALPPAAVTHLLALLALSRPGTPHPGVAEVRRACDPESLSAFGWELFRRWEDNGAPSGDGWAFTQLGLLGDDGTVRRLVPLVRAWPGKGGHGRAVAGLDVLAGIGTGLALAHLHGIAETARYRGLRERARERFAEVARRRGLTVEQLADRAVPDLGLPADGVLTLDYGPRRFTVGFDERLALAVRDEDGRPRKALPKPGVKDDETLAAAARRRFAVLREDVRAVADGQVRRLETAMVTGASWTPEDFRSHVVGHPLLWHLARRLVWLAETGAGTTAFRPAEDRTFADVNDDALTLPGTARIGVAHPARLGGDLGAWAEVFDDYEIAQPFPQLDRPVHALADAERHSARLTRFEGVTVPVGRILDLERRGWRRGEPWDGGVADHIARPAPGGLHVVIDLDPGVVAGHPADSGDQLLDRVRICEDLEGRDDATHAFGELDPVTASEVLADLAGLTETPA